MIKLKKGSKEAKQFMAKLRAKRKMSGNNKRVYIDFYNKKKNFKQDRKYFKSDEEAKKWALKNLQKFDIDMIKEESANLGKIKKTVKKVKRKISGNPRRETQHKDTKSHNVNIRVLSGIKENYLKDLSKWVNLANSYESDLIHWKKKLNEAKKNKITQDIKTNTGYVKLFTRELKNIKEHISKLKKHI